MIILNDTTPTSELTAIKVGDSISNGIGTFGEVENIKFENGDGYWEFTFALVGGGLVQVRKSRTTC